MVDFKSILGTLLESGLAPSASQRIGSAVNAQQSGGLGSMFGGAGGGLASMLGGGQGGGSSDIGSMLGGLLGNAQGAVNDTKQQVQAGNPMAVGGLGALAGALLGGVRGSPAKGAIGGAALAVLGQIAMSALQKGMSGGSAGLAEAAPADAAYQQASVDELTGDARAELLLRAMINAAKADGQIDGTEMNNILGKLDEAGAGQDAKDFVLAEMRRPARSGWAGGWCQHARPGRRGLCRVRHGDQDRYAGRGKLSEPACDPPQPGAAGPRQPRRQPRRWPGRLEVLVPGSATGPGIGAAGLCALWRLILYRRSRCERM